tara:strand:+ start:126 stop:335 length:210 start_codon:yes stop_codon:yes gene_type:complete
MDFFRTLILLTLSIFINAIAIGSIGFFLTSFLRSKGKEKPFIWWAYNGRKIIFPSAVILSLIYYYTNLI